MLLRPAVPCCALLRCAVLCSIVSVCTLISLCVCACTAARRAAYGEAQHDFRQACLASQPACYDAKIQVKCSNVCVNCVSTDDAIGLSPFTLLPSSPPPSELQALLAWVHIILPCSSTAQHSTQAPKVHVVLRQHASRQESRLYLSRVTGRGLSALFASRLCQQPDR